MKNYNQLTQEQRYDLERLLSIGTNKNRIAIELEVNPSTIYREIKRNSDARNGKYSAKLAQRKCESRHLQKRKYIKFSEPIKQETVRLLSSDFSPEQIHGFLKREQKDTVSTERIYQFIWEDKKQGGVLYKHLRTKGKRYRKRGALKDNRGIIKGRVDIEKRSPIVENKERLGDLELDTIIGKDHKGAIVTINDRATGMLKMKLVKVKEASLVAQAIIDELQEWKPFLKTLTADNGKEFAEHQKIAEELNVNFYFAKPYHSWQRGANENLNGLVRQYFPKGTSFSDITQFEIKKVENILNNRPRKRYDFYSPLDIFAKKVNQINFLHL